MMRKGRRSSVRLYRPVARGRVQYNEFTVSNLMSGIDARVIQRHVESRLASSPALEQPVPHVIVTECLPTDFYRDLAAAWPAVDLFKRDKAGRKYDLVPGSATIDSRSAGWERMPTAQRAIWDFFVSQVNREIVAPLLVRLFNRQVQERLRYIQEALDDGLVEYGMAGARDGSYRANVGRFMMRAHGYELKPHVDSMPYLVTVLHYFPDDEGDNHSGTIFYKAERPLDFRACVRDGSTQYFHDAGIACTEVMRVPFRPNTMVAFPNTLDAAHGSVAPGAVPRKVFQYHISLKGDDEKV